MNNCLFCNIAAHKIPAEIVFENNAAVAFLDIHPRAPGHAMVIPKSHAETVLDLDEEFIAPLFKAVKQTTHMIERALKPDAFTIGINHGKHAGQAVEHLHVHIMPRFKGDKGGSIHTVVDNPPKDAITEIAAKIRAIT
jgi:histidine triad (HIT) family protein